MHHRLAQRGHEEYYRNFRACLCQAGYIAHKSGQQCSAVVRWRVRVVVRAAGAVGSRIDLVPGFRAARRRSGEWPSLHMEPRIVQRVVRGMVMLAVPCTSVALLTFPYIICSHTLEVPAHGDCRLCVLRAWDVEGKAGVRAYVVQEFVWCCHGSYRMVCCCSGGSALTFRGQA